MARFDDFDDEIIPRKNPNRPSAGDFEDIFSSSEPQRPQSRRPQSRPPQTRQPQGRQPYRQPQNRQPYQPSDVERYNRREADRYGAYFDDQPQQRRGYTQDMDINSGRPDAPVRRQQRPAGGQPRRKPSQQELRSASKPPQRNSRKPKRRAKKAKRIIAAVCLLLIVDIGALGVYAYSLLGTIDYKESSRTNVYVNESDLYSSKKVRNILLIGVDEKAGTNARSDTMMLVSIDKRHKKIKMTSFLRDSWVYIPDHGYDKLNASFAYGSADLVMDTIEYNFGVKIDNYALVDFEMFSSLIDGLGGITVEVTEAEADFINRTTRHTISSGDAVHMNGDVALVYVRIRYLDNDFMRTYRQRKVMEAMMRELKSASVIQLMKSAKEVLPEIETDISSWELTKIASGAVSYMRYETDELRIPVDGSFSDKWEGNQQVISIDFDENRKALYQFIYEGVTD